ncbi:hypothetical protein [Streptomyces sp. NPDC041003]|uniref:hypothetical protein n=1 Tax=Streptomyces sp. NPDC041003 TaxID=3155730 RepID=UPI0033FA04FC
MRKGCRRGGSARDGCSGAAGQLRPVPARSLGGGERGKGLGGTDAARRRTFPRDRGRAADALRAPQENGNRADIRWATFTDGVGNGLRVVGEEPFDFAARRWTDQQLDAARQPSDLVPGPVSTFTPSMPSRASAAPLWDPVSCLSTGSNSRRRTSRSSWLPCSRAETVERPAAPEFLVRRVAP